MLRRYTYIITVWILLVSQTYAQGVAVGTRIDLTNKLQLNQGTTGQFAQLFIPDYFVPDSSGQFTLVFHLHSASWAAEDEVYRSATNAILFNIHLGGLSSPYQNYFSDATRYSAILDTVVSLLQEQNILPGATLGRVIMTSFSAGYAGVREILKTAAYYNQISALTLADGLHSSSDPGLMAIQMADFLRFARDARAGEKVMLLTHSSITTSGYQSTTQTANYLIAGLNATRVPDSTVDEIGTRYSRCDTGNFHLKGYLGQTANDHLQHLYGMYLMLERAVDILDSGVMNLDEETTQPKTLNLYSYPNPFNTTTTIHFTLPERSLLRCSVYDCLGREIVVLFAGVKEAGEQSLAWSATDHKGRPVSSGLYLYRFQLGEYIETGKLLLLR
ncbi:MAG: T9SS type A sorting domain-containing protein [Fidelibacterota bacterium]